MANRSRRLETVTVGDVEIVTCVEGEGSVFVMLPSYGRDGLGDCDHVAGQVNRAGFPGGS